MELIEDYLNNKTMIADFWIADKENNIISFENEGITIEKSKIYLKAYNINIYIKKEHYPSLNKSADGWKDKHPKAVITKANGRVEAYELRFKEVEKKDNHVILKFSGELF